MCCFPAGQIPAFKGVFISGCRNAALIFAMKKTKDSDKRKIIEKWIQKNGCADFDLKNKTAILYDGGLFSIEKEKYLAHKVVGRKKLPNGCIEILFSKKKCVPSERYKAYLWFEELDDTINYFKRMKKLLVQLGYETKLK